MTRLTLAEIARAIKAVRRDGIVTAPLQPSRHFPGRITDGCRVWNEDGTLAGAEPGGPLDLVGIVERTNA